LFSQQEESAMASSTAAMHDLEDAISRALDRRVRSPWLNTEQAAEYLKTTPGTLKTWRATGAGPRYHGTHRFVRYHTDELDAFMRGEAAR
jgi:hypothetical protein